MRTLSATPALIASLIMPVALWAAPTTESIDAAVERTMTEFGVPGMTVSVVHQGEVVRGDEELAVFAYGGVNVIDVRDVDLSHLLRAGAGRRLHGA